jgi:hypothetical protein
MSARTCPLFPLGQIVATPNALAQITQADIMTALLRHTVGDWGELDTEDKLTNDRAVVDGTRILSAYRAANGTKFWIITDAGGIATTILLPEDY